MAGLPQGYSEEISTEQGLHSYQRFTDGEYLLLIKECTYEQVKTESGKEPAAIFRHRIVESGPHPQGQPAGVQPLAAGTDADYFCPDYGKSKVMFKKKIKGYVDGLTGIDKSVDPKIIAATTDKLFDPNIQLARGMLIRAVTFHFETKDGNDGIGLDFFPVPGENHPEAEGVKRRRAELDAEKAAGKAATPPTNGQQQQQNQAPPSLGGPPPIAGGPPPLAADPMAGWQPHPEDKTGTIFWKPGMKRAYKREQIMAGQATE